MLHKVIEIIDYLAVKEVDYAVGVSGVLMRVCHHYYSRTFGMQFILNGHDFGSVGRIEVAGRFVCKDQSRP